MITIIYIFYVDNFSIYSFILDSHNNDHIFIMFLRIIVHFSRFIYHVSITYHVLWLKINLWTYRIGIISDTRIIFVHHKLLLFTLVLLWPGVLTFSLVLNSKEYRREIIYKFTLSTLILLFYVYFWVTKDRCLKYKIK